MPAHRPNDLPITSNPTPGPPRNSPISSLASNQLPRRRSCALAPAGLYRRDRTVAIAIARPAPARDQSSRAEPRLHTLGIGRYQQQLQSRKALAPRVRVGEPANARRACFRPHPQQTIYSGRVPSPPAGYASVRERSTDGGNVGPNLLLASCASLRTQHESRASSAEQGTVDAPRSAGKRVLRRTSSEAATVVGRFVFAPRDVR